MHFVATAVLSISLVMVLQQSVAAGEFREYAPKGKSVPIKLLVWPSHVEATQKGAVSIYVALVNDADLDINVRESFEPTPSVPVSYGDLVTHIVDESTGKEAQFKPPPLPYTIEDAQRREMTKDIGVDEISGVKLDLRRWYNLPPGKYQMTMRFNSLYVPSFLRPDKRAWHGQTNAATVKIEILS